MYNIMLVLFERVFFIWSTFNWGGSTLLDFPILCCLEVLSSELATEHAQCEQSSQAARALESAEQEKEQLRVELEKQVQENIQLVK